MWLFAAAARALDKYFELRQAAEEKSAAAGTTTAEAAIDPRLEAIVERMLARCLADKQFEQVSPPCKLISLHLFTECTAHQIASLSYLMHRFTVLILLAQHL